jgi:glutathione S-transferase
MTHAPHPPLRLRGAPGSPYTRKMLALLRYRRIPYHFVVRGSREDRGLPEPKVPLLPTFFLPGPDGRLEAAVDSTPLIRRFEREFAGRQVVPPRPALAFLDALLEDYADEWLTRPMFHYRWAFAPDVAKASAILPLWSKIDLPADVWREQGRLFAARQIGRLGVVGSNDVTGPVIEASYRRFLARFDAVLAAQPFLMGGRPGASDFGVYGQLTQLALFDPTPAAVTLAEAPRCVAWVERMEDLSGLEPADDGWISADPPPEPVRALLAEVGRVHAPFLLANADAVARGAEQVACSLDGKPWRQAPFPYQAKCLAALRQLHATLEPGERRLADAALVVTGCEVLFAS